MYKNIAIILSAAIFNHSIMGMGMEAGDLVSGNHVSSYAISTDDILKEGLSDVPESVLSENISMDPEDDMEMPKEMTSYNEEYGEDNEGAEIEPEEIEEVIDINDISENEDEEQDPIEKVVDIVSENENEKVSEAAEGETTISENEEKQETEEMAMMKVSMPANVKVCFDPMNLYGKGEIFSEKYEIANYGNRDIAIKIKDIDIMYNDEEEAYTFYTQPIKEKKSEKKLININVVWENKNEGLETILNVVDGQADEYVIYLKAAKFDKNGKFIGLDEGSKGCFYFTGTLNSNPDIQWNDNEISVNYKYELVDVEAADTKKEIMEYIERGRNAGAAIP